MNNPTRSKTNPYLTMDERFELSNYQAFRTVRHIRDEVCKNSDAKKFLTRVMRRLTVEEAKHE